MEKSVTLLGRILLGHIFLIAGIGKISSYAGTMGYMESMGVPGVLLPAVILLELGGGLALILGFQTRVVAAALALFCAAAAAIFHNDFGNQMQMIMFMKNFAMAGGLLYVVAFGAGALSIDAKLAQHKHHDEEHHTPHGAAHA